MAEAEAQAAHRPAGYRSGLPHLAPAKGDRLIWIELREPSMLVVGLTAPADRRRIVQ